MTSLIADHMLAYSPVSFQGGRSLDEIEKGANWDLLRFLSYYYFDRTIMDE